MSEQKHIDALQEELRVLFEDFHRYPELALEEYETTAWIREEIAKTKGVELLHLGLPTGVLARIVGDPKGPVVAIRADIDALPVTEKTGLPYASEVPGKMHACGHDFHLTSLIGDIKLLAARKAEIPGTVVFLFQPAEEAEHGGEKVVQTGLIEREKITHIFGLHVRTGLPVGTIAVSKGPFSAACDRFLYRIRGKGCHGSAPQDGLDPIVAGSRLVTSLQEVVSRTINARDTIVVSVTRFTSGKSWNVIPEEAELEGTVRSFDPALREEVKERLERKGKALEAEGYSVEFDWLPGCPATDNDKKLATLIEETAKQQGYLVIPQQPEMGGEDFSCYQEKIPGGFFHIGVGGQGPAHNERFFVDEKALAPSCELMTEIVLRDLAILANGLN